jgi:hypothetical protein
MFATLKILVSTFQGCKPYSALAYLYKTTPPCQKRCQLNYNTPYEVDKSFALSIYKVSSEEEQIQMEIMTNGPVMTTYTVFEDFYSYQRGRWQEKDDFF